MKALLLTLTLLLVGCSTPVPITPKFPDAPRELMLACPKLKPLEDKAELSDLAKAIVTNYSEYHICATRVESWNEWYTQQKKLFEALK